MKDSAADSRTMLFAGFHRSPGCSPPISTDFTNVSSPNTGAHTREPFVNNCSVSTPGRSVSPMKPASTPIGRVSQPYTLDSNPCAKQAAEANSSITTIFLIIFCPFADSPRLMKPVIIPRLRATGYAPVRSVSVRLWKTPTRAYSVYPRTPTDTRD